MKFRKAFIGAALLAGCLALGADINVPYWYHQHMKSGSSSGRETAYIKGFSKFPDEKFYLVTVQVDSFSFTSIRKNSLTVKFRLEDQSGSKSEYYKNPNFTRYYVSWSGFWPSLKEGRKYSLDSIEYGKYFLESEHTYKTTLLIPLYAETGYTRVKAYYKILLNPKLSEDRQRYLRYELKAYKKVCYNDKVKKRIQLPEIKLKADDFLFNWNTCGRLSGFGESGFYVVMYFFALLFSINIEFLVLLALFKPVCHQPVKNNMSRLAVTCILATGLTLTVNWGLFSLLASGYLVKLIVAEVFAIGAVALIYKYLLRINLKQAIVLSFACNLASYLAGVALFISINHFLIVE